MLNKYFMLKKTFLISAISFGVILLLWGIYFLSFQKPSVKDSSQDESETVQEIAEPIIPKTGKLVAITEEAVLAPTINETEDGIKYYNKNTGQVFQVDFDGDGKETLSSKELSGILNIFWSPDKTKVLSRNNVNGAERYGYYSYEEVMGGLLHENIQSLSWQNNRKIIYSFFNTVTKKDSLNMADYDGANWSKISDLDSSSIFLAPIPKTGLISFWNEPDASQESKLSSVPTIGGEIKIISSGNFGADYLWNEDGTLALSSHSDSKNGLKMQLGSFSADGSNYKDLDLPTFISKCIWKNTQSVYCALPSSIPENSVLPNSYYQGNFNTTDTFWEIDVLTGEKKRIVDLKEINGQYDATNLFLSPDKGFLFFVNRTDEKLYRIEL
ncbi:MAG: hypothetical protein COU40_03460 [Candidatus Moranbacteria bacterium CG10_big_fil_rev_8_21_14_0_10_35_21]|nr:MAG: hypothetical protein COU40_03460 [Candidatus Moranbacteria bacterium CG10_big_fil_rev_8_21_14_0_10_35_21]PJA88370.1 MAG: hypothetical protein CO139_03585 [Candidatus Moranbacteria bacterium CG_4_9_14_3_um_filter_36_9]